MLAFKSGERAGHGHGPDRARLLGPGDRADRRLARAREVSGLRSRRRTFAGGLALLGAAAMARPARGQSPGRVVVVGGGFAGATCARELRRGGVDVTLVEPQTIYTACPMSNAVHGRPARDRGAALRLRRVCGSTALPWSKRRPSRSRSTGGKSCSRTAARHRLRPPRAGAGHRSPLRRAPGLRRGCGRDHAARLEGRTADRAAAAPAGGDARRRHGRHVRARQPLSLPARAL